MRIERAFVSKLKKSALWVTLAAFAGISLGCAHYYYAPNAVNVPLFQKKNEARVNGSIQALHYILSGGADVQAAYSISDHVGVISNFMSVSGGDESVHDYWQGYLWEGAGGYFTPYKKFVFEVYGGGGGGEVKNVYNEYHWTMLSYMRFFLQPSAGYASKHFDFAASCRFADLQLKNIRGYPGEHSTVLYLKDNATSFLIEPALTCRIGFRYLKLQLQYMWSINSTHPKFPQDVGGGNIGLMIPVDNFFRPKEKH